jgi:hypothetical protein
MGEKRTLGGAISLLRFADCRIFAITLAMFARAIRAILPFRRVREERLARAFPVTMREEALKAASEISGHLQMLGEGDFTIFLQGEAVVIPDRLYFAARPWKLTLQGEAAAMVRCLHTRSDNGYERQEAVRHLLEDPQPWCSPFIIALIGSYVIEILDDIHAALTPSTVNVLASFLVGNPDFWELTRQRVTSYWNANYRHTPRRDYVGFKIVEVLDTAVRTRKHFVAPRAQR